MRQNCVCFVCVTVAVSSASVECVGIYPMVGFRVGVAGSITGARVDGGCLCLCVQRGREGVLSHMLQCTHKPSAKCLSALYPAHHASRPMVLPGDRLLPLSR